MSNWQVEFKVKHTQCNRKDDPNRDELKTLVQGLLTSRPELQVLDNSLKVIKKAQGGAKAKGIGSDFERKVVKVLSDWYKIPLRRTPNSGGWDKQVKDGQAITNGDIYAAPEHKFPFCIECKHRKEPLNLFAIDKKGKDCIHLWWEQCANDADNAKKIPLLVMGCDRTDYIAFRNGESFKVLKKVEGLILPVVAVYKGELQFFVMLLDHFIMQFQKE